MMIDSVTWIARQNVPLLLWLGESRGDRQISLKYIEIICEKYTTIIFISLCVSQQFLFIESNRSSIFKFQWKDVYVSNRKVWNLSRQNILAWKRILTRPISSNLMFTICCLNKEWNIVPEIFRSFILDQCSLQFISQSDGIGRTRFFNWLLLKVCSSWRDDRSEQNVSWIIVTRACWWYRPK